MKTDVGLAFDQIVTEFQKRFDLSDGDMIELLMYEKYLKE